MLAIQLNVCYIVKHLEDGKALSVQICYTWCDILIFKLHGRTRLKPRSSIHSFKIRMTSHTCNKYEQITPSYLLSINYILKDNFWAHVNQSKMRILTFITTFLVFSVARH